jgi:hypothetical protein
MSLVNVTSMEALSWAVTGAGTVKATAVKAASAVPTTEFHIVRRRIVQYSLGTNLFENT